MNSYQVTLFLEEDTIYKISKVSSEILNEIEEIGEPILMPDNMGAPREANIPLVIFNKNSRLQIIMSFQTIVISIEEEQGLMDKLAKIINILENNHINSNRLGYVKKVSLDNEKIIEFKNSTFNNQEIINCKEFEFSCLYDIIINDINVNCWERYYTNKEINDRLNILFDINTKATEKHNINIEFIKKFIRESDTHVENRIFK